MPIKKFKFLYLLLAFYSLSIYSQFDTGHSIVSIHKISKKLDDKNIIGIKIDLDEGWHTYWKNPGDAGGPIIVNISSPEKINIKKIYFPPPELIPYEPLMTYGYKQEVLFPIEIDNTALIDQDTVFDFEINLLICEDVCIPESAVFSLKYDDFIASDETTEWLKTIPDITYPVLTFINKKNNTFEIKFSGIDEISNIYFFPENENIFNYAAIQKLSYDGKNYLLEINVDEITNINKQTTVTGILKINDQYYKVKSNPNIKEIQPSNSVLKMLLFAFIGGLILNLMPCVFPVISLKVLSMVKMGGESQSKIITHSMVFSIGVIVSFIAIAALVTYLRSTGEMIGWGFQLQSPYLVSVLSSLMIIIGFVLLMDINLGMSLTRLGNTATNSSLLSSFSTGVLAVIVASPCTAPFMGAAIGYALLESSSSTYPIFLSLSLGFSFPYILLALNPSLIQKLPKPGNWMNVFKEFMAFPMFATAIWLLWVFSLQVNTNSLIELILIWFLIGIFFWLTSKTENKILKLISILIILISVFTQTANINNEISETNFDQTKSNDYILWNQALEDELISNNKSFFINYTAAWCITCQANEKIALSSLKVKNYFKSQDIAYLKADWTNKSPEILESLKKYGRTGVPLYIYWEPSMSEPRVLPAILTEKIIFDYL
jgi:thiol:disulfide interchange protein